MNPITKAFVSNKFSSAEKSLGFGSNDNTGQTSGNMSAKELRKLEEEEAARRAKKQQEHDKRAVEREKKREEIRAKYGLRKGSDGKNKGRRADESDSSDLRRGDENTEDKNCCVM